MLINEIAGKISSASILERSLVVKQSIVQLKEAHPDDLPSQLADAQQIEKRITISNAAEWWRNRAVPALLQDKSSFADTSLIIAATHPASAIASPWSAGETWVTPWVKQCLLVNKPFLRGFLDSFANEEPVADHPLILRVARNFLFELFAHPEGQAKALAFAQWAEPRSLANPDKAMTAGDLVIALAEQRKVVVNADGTLGTDGEPESEEWQKLIKRILNGIVENSEQGEHIPESWQNQSERIAELLNACPPWQREGVRRLHIQRRAQNRLRTSLETLDAEARDALDVFPNKLDEVDRAMSALDTTVRFRESFWKNNNTAFSNYIDGLTTNRTLIENSTGKTAVIRRAAENIFQKQQDFIGRSQSPIVRTEVFRATAPHKILGSSTALAFMQRQGAELPADRLLETFSDLETWQAETRRRAADADAHSKAWRVLEAWDGLRGRGSVIGDATGKKAAQELYNRLPGWLTGTAALPPNADAPDTPWQELRPLLAAVTLLGLPDNLLNSLHGRLRNIIEPLDQKSSLHLLLAAAHIELSLTRMVSGETKLPIALDLLNPGSAAPDTESLKQLAAWSADALNSPFSWESRAGMNGLILLCRLAETTGNIFAANLLPAVSDSAKTFIADALRRLRAGERTGEFSDLPLAFVAFDLARARREAAEGLLPKTAADLAAKRPWLQYFNDTEQTNFTPHSLTQDLISKLGGSTNIATSFLSDTRLAGRALLLSLFEAQLGVVQQQQRLRITPLDKGDDAFEQLDQIKNKARQLFCIERILLADRRRLNKLQENFVPWWRIGFWSDELAEAASDEKKRSLSEGVASWLASFNGEAEARLLAWAADLESAVPVPNPNSDRDIDGRSVWALPKFTWGKAMEDLTEAIAELEKTEEKYKKALTVNIDATQRQEFVKLLRQPLELNIADFQEQIDAAIAEVRAAEADLEAAKHLSLAAELETIAAGFIYEAAKFETERRKLLEEVAGKEEDVARLNTEIAGIQEKIANNGTLSAEEERKFRKNAKESAKISLEIAEVTHQALNKRIALLRKMLQEEHEYKGSKVSGQIGFMGAQISDTLSTKLAADLEDAEKDLVREEEKERRRKKLERQNRLIKSALRFVGAVVGFICGGPAGATLGAEIGGAIAELREGIISNKPPEEILLGLVDNGIAIAEASGVDLKGELNALGQKGAEKVTAFFNELESGLGPIFDTMPNLLDEQVFKDALVVMGLDDEVPDFMERIESTYAAFKKDAGNLGKLGDALFGEDKDGKTVLQFDDPKKLRDHLKDNLFGNTLEEHAALKKVAKQIGSDVNKLATPEGLEEAKERLANIVVTKVSEEAVRYRDEIIRQWSLPKVQEGKLWQDETVQEEAKLLLDNLYPNEKDRKELEKGLDRLLGGKEILQAQVETLLAGWQGELDTRIAEISKACNEKITRNPPKSAVAAARARCDYIKEFQKGFSEGRIPSGKNALSKWLQGDSQERRDLFIQFDELQDQAEQSKRRLEHAKIDLENTDIQLNQAVIAFDTAQKEAKIAGIGRIKADLEAEKTSLMVRVSNLAGLEAGKEEEAKNAAAKARKAEQEAAKQLVLAAEAELVAAQAREKGAALRGAAARRIRSSLSLPVFSFSSAGDADAAFAREEHAEALDDTFRAIRELLSHVRAAGVSLGTDLQHLDAVRPDGGANLWSSVISQYKDSVKKIVIDDQTFAPTAGKRHIRVTNLELKDEHLANLFGKGLTIFFGPNRPNHTSEELGRIVGLVKGEEAQSGRILAVIFGGQFTDGSQLINGPIQEIHAVHLGDRWLAPSETHLTDQQEIKGKRLFLSGTVDPNDVDATIKRWLDSANMAKKFTIGGDPRFETHEGVSLSGTLVLRLEKAPTAPEIKELSIVIPYVYYDK